jgi:hypothetical protein
LKSARIEERRVTGASLASLLARGHITDTRPIAMVQSSHGPQSDSSTHKRKLGWPMRVLIGVKGRSSLPVSARLRACCHLPSTMSTCDIVAMCRESRDEDIVTLF